MFDPGLASMIEGLNIDCPFNALTFTPHFHQLFGRFEIQFVAVENLPHTYRIDLLESRAILRDPMFPITRTLYLTPDRTIDPASPRLLKVHSAIAQIFYASGAAEYCDKVLEDMESPVLEEQGSCDVGCMVSLKLDGWLEDLTAY